MSYNIAQKGGKSRSTNDLVPVKLNNTTLYRDVNSGTYYLKGSNNLMYVARLSPALKTNLENLFKQDAEEALNSVNNFLIDSTFRPDKISTWQYSNNISSDLSVPGSNKGSNKGSSFSSAFKNARALGLGEFTWNGRRYTTQKAGESKELFTAWKNSHNTVNAPSPLISTPVSDTNNPKISEAPLTPTWNPTSANTFNFNRKDIKGLGFNNYQGMVDYVKLHGDTDFSKSLVNRFGDVSNWNLSKVENDLGVSGTYRPIQGDFMRITNSMNNFNKDMGYTGTQYIGDDGKFYSTLNAANAIHTLNKLNLTYNLTPTLTSNVPTEPITKTSTQNNTLIYTKPSLLLSNFNDKMNNLAKLTWNGFSNNKKFQKGGTIKMEESSLQQAFLKFLAEETGAKSQAELEQVIQKLGKEGLQEAYAQFMQIMQQEQIQAAKFGAKLNYINKLNGRCPEGTKLTYFKEGGKLCKKCMTIQAKGGEIDKPKKNIIDDFKASRKKSVKKIACGSKIRK